jgi:hypothetical protein
VHEFLSIYPDRSLDIDDYYQVDCMARPPNNPPQFVIINEEGVIVYEEGLVPVPMKLMPTDSLSNYGGPAWYMRKHFHVRKSRLCTKLPTFMYMSPKKIKATFRSNQTSEVLTWIDSLS